MKGGREDDCTTLVRFSYYESWKIKIPNYKAKGSVCKVTEVIEVFFEFIRHYWYGE